MQTIVIATVGHLWPGQPRCHSYAWPQSNEVAARPGEAGVSANYRKKGGMRWSRDTLVRCDIHNCMHWRHIRAEIEREKVGF
jgi:hypothetical protein